LAGHPGDVALYRRLGDAVGGPDVVGDRLSTGAASRPLKKTVAPSRAKALAMAPPAPKITALLFSSSILVLLRSGSLLVPTAGPSGPSLV
jgi:hypothetical protein